MNPFTEQQFKAALDSRDIIGQAKGVIMVRAGVTADAAFDVLVAMSQRSNVVLRIVARDLVDSLPGAVEPSTRTAETVTTDERTQAGKRCPTCGQQCS